MPALLDEALLHLEFAQQTDVSCHDRAQSVSPAYLAWASVGMLGSSFRIWLWNQAMEASVVLACGNIHNLKSPRRKFIESMRAPVSARPPEHALFALYKKGLGPHAGPAS